MTRPTLLIPVTFPNPELHPLTDINVEALAGFNIVLLGYWELSGQSTEVEARSVHETEAEAVLYEIAARFSHAGAPTDIELHFGPGGPEKRKRQERIVEEADPDGVLLADYLSTPNNILVPLRDDRRREKIVEFVSAFDAESIFVVELYHAATGEGALESAEAMLRTVEDGLLARGFSESDLETTVEVTEDPKAGIAARALNHNVVVIGETEDSKAENRVFGSVDNYLRDRTDTPVIIVR